MNLQPENNKNNKNEDDNMDYTVFTVPSSKPWILSKKEAEEFLKNMSAQKITKEDRAEVKKRVEKLLKKPEKKQGE